MHAIVWVLVQVVLIPLLILFVFTSDGAGSEGDKLVQAICEEFFFKIFMGKSVEHLDCSLRIANVVDFLSSRHLLHLLDVCYIVVDSHLGP